MEKSIYNKSYNYGLDLLRIISMLSIICLHIVNTGGGYTNSNRVIDKYIFMLFYMLIVSSVNVFAMLSGYLYAPKDNVKNKNVISIIAISLFCYVVITAVFLVIYRGQLGFGELVYGLCPPLFGRSWYLVCYVLLFFCIPYINLFIHKISQKTFAKLLVLLFALLSVLPTLLFTDFFRMQNGYTPWWLIYCYMIGAYVRLYGLPLKNKLKCGLFFSLICAVLALLVVIISGYFQKSTSLIREYTSPTTVLIALLILYVFKDIKLPVFLQKPIKALSTTAFSVYILHSNTSIMDYWIHNRFSFLDDYNVFLAVIFVVLISVLVYLACSLIDFIRIWVFKLLQINKLIDYLGNKLDKVLSI